jgi:hypothetical protein
MHDQHNATIGSQLFRSQLPVRVLAAAGTSLALLLAGCGSPGAPAASPSSAVSAPSSSDAPTEPVDAVRWMDGFCGAVEGFLKDHNNNATQIPGSVSMDDGRQLFSTMLDDYAAILSKAIDRLADLPPIADPVGQTAKQTFAGNYTSARDMVTSAKTQLDAASPTDFDALTHAAEALATAQQTALTALSPEMAVVNSPELRTAIQSADRCASVS